MSVETSDQPTEVKEKTETFPETGGIVGGSLAILNEISTHRRSTSVFHRVATTLTVTSLLLSACVPLQASSSPSYPTEQQGITQPVDTSILPTLTDAQETGAMIAQTQEGRAFYNALSVHDVDPSACSPDVLGNLVIEKELPLGEASDLMTITTDALVNTPEPDHLTTIVCDVKEADDGTQTVSPFFHADTDHTGDGVPDIFIPSQAKVLLPGELVDGVPQVVAPAVGGESPVGSTVTAPDWSPAGGEIPAEIRDLMTVEEQSIRYSLAEKNINTDSVLIHPVFRGSGDDFRMGSGVTNVNQTIAFYPQFDDDGALAWRPDLRSGDRPWHWEQVSLPEGVDGKIEVVFDPDSEAPQFVVLTPDESRMIGWFNNLTRQWLTVDGEELMPPPTPTPEPRATPTLAPASDALREFSQLNISFPDRLQAESHEDGFKTRVVLSEDLMKNTGITDLNIPEDQMDQIGKYILGVAMWGNRTANPKLSAFAQLPNLDVSGDKVVAFSESLLMSGNSVELSFSDGQRTIKGPVSSLQVMFVTLAESDKIFKTIQEGSAQYVDDEFVNTRANSRFRILLFMNNNQLTVVHASNSPGIEMPFSGGAKYRIAFEAYLNAGMRNNTERLVDFSTMLYFINETLVRFAPAHDDYRQAFINYAAPYPISNFLCSGTWDRDLAFKNNTYWRGEGGKLTGCDPAAIKLFSPKTP